MGEDREIWDISPEISSQTAVFPGDEPFRRKVILDFPKDGKDGGNLLLSNISTTVHIGAHVDAPSHYHPQGPSISECALDSYLGDCQVVSVTVPKGGRIRPSDFASIKIRARRVLFKTGSYPDPNHWNADFNSLSAELVHALADQGVVLIGIDTPSVDPAEDQALEAHTAIHERKLANLEGIVLTAVSDGIYELIALPLKIKDADASPVRAVLRR